MLTTDREVLTSLLADSVPEEVNKLVSFLQQSPNEKELIVSEVTGRRYLPIDMVETDLHTTFPFSWGTRDFQFQIIEGVAYCSILLYARFTVKGKEYEITQVGVSTSTLKVETFNLDDDKKIEVHNTLEIAKSEALKNAAKLLGKRFAGSANREDNLDYVPASTDTIKEMEGSAEFKKFRKQILGYKKLDTLKKAAAKIISDAKKYKSISSTELSALNQLIYSQIKSFG